MVGALILQIILIFLNAIFACAEIAVISSKGPKMEKLAEEGDKRAKRLLSMTENPSKFLSTIQVAITLAALLGSAYAADHFAEPLVNLLLSRGIPLSAEALKSVCVFLITIILSYFSIVFGELIPKRLAMNSAETLALLLSGLLCFVSKIFAPFVWILTKSTNGILRLLRIDPSGDDETVTEEEIRMMLDSGSEKGTIDSVENEIIQNVFKFDDVTLAEICTHRRDVTFLYMEDGLADWRETIVKSRYAFYPICGKSIDDVVGVLNGKKFLRLGTDDSSACQKAMEKPYFAPDSMKADALFEIMKKTRNYFAVVTDEYGGTYGVITVHDLLEFLVGDLGDHEENREEEIESIAGGGWKIFGSASLEKVGEKLDIEFDTEEWDTFGGYIFGLLQSIPDDGAQPELETEDLKIKVLSVVDHRIERTLVYKKP